MNGLTIGKLATATGVAVETIRYYQSVGLMRQPKKPASGYRRYSDDAVARLAFIRRAKRLGFSLTEIKELLDLGDGHCKDVLELAEQKLQRVDDQLADLKAIKGVLDELISGCREQRSTEHCSLINALYRAKTARAD